MDRLAQAATSIEAVEKWLRTKLEMVYRGTAVEEQYATAIRALRDARDAIKTEREARKLGQVG